MTLVGEIDKNSKEKIRIRWETYKGVCFLDVRAHYKDDMGEWVPTKKGIAISPNKIEDLVELLRKAQEQMPDQKELLNVDKG